MKGRVSREQDTIVKLNAQLDDFIKTKNETETAMLQQFMELLNEKKRKIRDQSRLLVGAKVDKTAGKFDIAFEKLPDSNTTQLQPFSQQEPPHQLPKDASPVHLAPRSERPQHKPHRQT